MCSLKKCSKCSQEKALTEFPTRKGSPDGLRNECKECRNASHKKWASENRESLNKKYREVYFKTYKAKNHDKLKKRWLDYSKENRAKKSESYKKWYQANPDKLAASNLRHR